MTKIPPKNIKLFFFLPKAKLNVYIQEGQNIHTYA